MRITDAQLDEVRERGFTVVEGFLAPDELKVAQEALWLHYPRPEEYFANPDEHAWVTGGQFAGLRLFPFKSWGLNRLAFHPDLVDAAERLLGNSDLDLYKIELWAKYSGAVDYDQPHHYDYGNHSLVVPRRDGRFMHMTTFLLLSDVTDLDGPTKLVGKDDSGNVPLIPRFFEHGAFADVEVAATGPAGTLLVYRTDVLHRASNFGAPGRSRFALLADYKPSGTPWGGKMSWPGRADHQDMTEVIVRATPRERTLLGFPPAGHEYWNDQTIADVETRYPGIDITPYR